MPHSVRLTCAHRAGAEITGFTLEDRKREGWVKVLLGKLPLGEEAVGKGRCLHSEPLCEEKLSCKWLGCRMAGDSDFWAQIQDLLCWSQPPCEGEIIWTLCYFCLRLSPIWRETNCDKWCAVVFSWGWLPRPSEFPWRSPQNGAVFLRSKEARASLPQPLPLWSWPPQPLPHFGAGVMKTGAAEVFIIAAHTNWLTPSGEGLADDTLISKQLLLF